MYCRGGIVAFIDIVNLPGSIVGKSFGQSAAIALPVKRIPNTAIVEIIFFII